MHLSKNHINKGIFIFLTGLLLISCSYFSKITIPDPLINLNQDKITSKEQWQNQRRGEILGLFQHLVYGKNSVDRPENMTFKLIESSTDAMQGAATRKQIEISYTGSGGTGIINLLLFIPNNMPKPVPCFLLINHREPENIDPTRKIKKDFWPAEMLIERGYAAAAFNVTDLAPNSIHNFQTGVFKVFENNQQNRPADAWGTIAAWAWGASRAMDYFETDDDIDQTNVAVIGHSRGGKTALWCGAQDNRFRLVISNEAGCTGDALSRRRKGETVRKINKRFPHWFCDNYNKFNFKEHKLPIDQHMLIALIAPRPVYVGSAAQNSWADPEGEFLACLYAEPVYNLFGLTGLGQTDMPEINQPIHNGYIGYHIRDGKHDLKVYDWKCFLDFTDKHLKKRNNPNCNCPNL